MPYLTEQNEISSQPLPEVTTIDRRQELSLVLLLICVGIVTVLAYTPVLGNFFNGDDFVHLHWLKNAVVNPELIWRNFHSAWLDVPTARFYRPLISCFMVADYLTLSRSGLAFHLTNLACHLLSVVFLYLVLGEITSERDAQDEGEKRNLRLWRTASAALFALYPLHAEAVSWITGRVDTIVTMFFLASFWCYLRWRSQQKFVWLAAACITFVASLLSKEMAIMLPPVLIAYELLLGRSQSPATQPQGGKPRLLTLLKLTWPFFVLLFAYLTVRTMSLGTAVGGYDDSLLPRIDRAFIRNSLHSLKLFLIPFNQEALTSHAALKCTWLFCLGSGIFFGIRSLFVPNNQRSVVVFLFAWLLLLFVPIFKLLAVSDDLQGTRLLYLPSVPLAALLCFGFSMLSLNRPAIRALKMILLAAMLAAAGGILYIHNGVWQQAGLQTQAIMRGLNNFYSGFSGDPPVFLVGLPDTIHGAYVMRNAIDGMTKSPQLVRDIKDCHPLDNFDRVFPFGMAKPTIAVASRKGQVLTWDKTNLNLSVASLKASDPAPSNIWSGTLSANSENKRMRPAAVLDFPNLSCFNVECLSFEIDLHNDVNSNQPLTASLLYTNDLQKEFDPAFRVDCQLSKKTGSQVLVFPLHSEVNWAMGGKCHQLKLMLPEGTSFTLKSISTKPLDLTIPELSMANTVNQYSLGYAQLDQQHSTCTLDFDVSSIPEAKAVGLELSRPNAFFQLHNSEKTDPNAAVVRTINAKKGTISVNLAEFANNGIYAARLRAVDTDGKPFGFSSDHIDISVNH